MELAPSHYRCWEQNHGIMDFEKQIRVATEFNKIQKFNFLNLTHPQQQALKSLKHNKKFIIILTDKN